MNKKQEEQVIKILKHTSKSIYVKGKSLEIANKRVKEFENKDKIKKLLEDGGKMQVLMKNLSNKLKKVEFKIQKLISKEPLVSFQYWDMRLVPESYSLLKDIEDKIENKLNELILRVLSTDSKECHKIIDELKNLKF